MEQLGHRDPKFTLRVYAHAMRFSEEDLARLKAIAEGGVLGTNWHWTLHRSHCETWGL
jgi:hypothetical protein